MSSIEERIQKHAFLMAVLEERMRRHNSMVLKWMQKYKFHENAIHNLKAKQEKKVD